MIITFHSQATGNLLMFRRDAENILSRIGKDISNPTGVITTEEMPRAIATLQAAIRQDQQEEANTEEARQDDAGDESDTTTTMSDAQVAFYQRALPFLNMLETCIREDKAITWGV